MPPPLGRAGGAIPGPPAGAMDAGGAALAWLGGGASLGPRAGVGPSVLGGSEVSSGGATTEATSPVPAGGAGIAAWLRDRSRSLGAAKTNPTAASTASRPITGAAMREKRLPTNISSARQRLS